MIQPPNQDQIDALVQRALDEDLGPGDITTQNIVCDNVIWEAEIRAKEPLVLCGTEIACRVFAMLDPTCTFPGRRRRDGEDVAKGEGILKVRANGIALLEGERTALNILQQLSGIATLTRKFVERARPVSVLDTRKTTPGLRVFEKYAVKCGGGTNHRFGLYDAVMIKDNHIQAAGSITQAVETIRSKLAHEKSIEVETTNLEEVAEALSAGVDIIMLDNMPTEMIRQAVKLVGHRVKLEVSGSISLERLDELSGTGIDYVSVGALTHSAPAVDISMSFLGVIT
ncbi:MAG: nicotinate-nucleotide diphosphorylase (carboxylating) [Nitrospinaceae bacterium]|nr:MAG: nicotinate-nucleotide diphosphorylase (carboxylating) [Nitrospinaceae bacterium]